MSGPNSTSEIVIYVWWCADDECDCTQPVVEIRSPFGWADYRWHPPITISKGPFLSQGYGSAEPEEIKAQKKWIEDAKSWYCEEAPKP